MRKSFCHQEAPLIVAVIKEANVRAMLSAVRNAEVRGAAAVDLHLSCLSREEQQEEKLKELFDGIRLPAMALHYAFDDKGKPYDIDEEERTGILRCAVHAGASCIDLQAYSFDRPVKDAFDERYIGAPYSFAAYRPREVVLDPAVIERQNALIDEVHDLGAEVLISTHFGKMLPCDAVVDYACFLEKRKPDAIKLVAFSENEEDIYEGARTMIKLKENVQTTVHYHIAGVNTRISRIINPLLGSYLIFCNDGYKEGADPNQPDLSVVKGILDGIARVR